MKVALGQINTTPNDFKGNLEQIIKFTNRAGEQQADLIVFPELSICGYLCKDILYRKNFLDQNLAALREITQVSRQWPKLTIVVGYVGKNTKGFGKPFTNMAAAIKNGLALTHYQKQLLPFYDVFDEGRYFEPGTLPAFIEVAGKRCILTICEDIWNDKRQDDYSYGTNPLANTYSEHYDVIINISSSPYAFGKPRQKHEMLSRIASYRQATLIYVNQIGGQDELVFDGRSCIYRYTNYQAHLLYEVPPTKSSNSTLSFVDFDLNPPIRVDRDDPGSPVEITAHNGSRSRDPNWATRADLAPVEELYNSLIIGLRDYIKKTGFTKVVLGSSGGIDSAVVAALACDAIGPENVHCLMMPSIWSSEGSLTDAKALHKNLGCKQYTIPIEYQHLVKSINAHFPEETSYNSVADENIQARLRGLTVMHASNAYGYLPLTTGNKTELALGYCTLYGDMAAGFNPIGDLYKDQVYAVARHINTGEIILDKTEGEIIPEAIITKQPSAELAPDQTDETGLGAPYAFLNSVVRAFVEHHINDYRDFWRWCLKDKWPFQTIDEATQFRKFTNGPVLARDSKAEDVYNKLIRRIDLMEFKRRQAAPTIKVSAVAFGTGRRLPIVQRQNYLDA